MPFLDYTGLSRFKNKLTDVLAPKASPALTGTPTAPTAAAGTNNTQIATTAFVNQAFQANDAMVFKGTIGATGSTVTALPATHSRGWTYRVITPGTYASETCEIGDMIICVEDGEIANDSDWTVVQNNTDGVVIGPGSSTDDHIVTFNGASGKSIKDSGFTIATSVPVDAVFTDTDTRVTSSANHYTPATDSEANVTASASGASAVWEADFVKGVTLTTDGKGHVTGMSVTSGKLPANPNTDTSVTSSANHYTPETLSTAGLTANASGATAVWEEDFVKGVTLSTDGKGHITGVSVSSGKLPANPNTDTHRAVKVNGSAALSNDTTPLDLTAGTNVSIVNSGSGVITISATDTTYSSLGPAEDGTAVSLVTTGEKYVWNASIPMSQKGANSGVAELDSNGKVLTSQLPAYVDDVIEFATADDFPPVGDDGVIYVTLDTNQTYRWGGSTYVVLPGALALGETSGTAYRGDRGKAAFDHAEAKGSLFESGLYKIATNSQGHVTSATTVVKSDITALGIPEADTHRTDASIVDLIYPVGSIYMSVNSTSPSTLFGGTWEQLQDRFLLGAGSSYTNGNTGGAASVSYTPAGSNSGGAVSNHTLTVAQIPSHNHSFTGSAVTSGGISANHTHTGTSGGISANHTHTGTSGNPSANHTHSGPSHTHTGPEHTHTAPSHTHTGPSHTHTGPSHYHSGPSHTHDIAGGAWAASGSAIYAPGANNGSTIVSTKAAGTGNTGSSGTGATGASGTGNTGSGGGSATTKAGTGNTGAGGTGATGTVSAWHTHTTTTGNQSAGHTHTTTTGNQSAGHTHSVTASGSIGNKGDGGAHNHGFTNPTFSGTAATIATMPPYLVVYMWKRTE